MFREPWIKLAEFYKDKNDYLLAVQCADAALKIKEIALNYMNDGNCYKSKPYDILYWGYYWLKDKESSYEAFKKAKSYNPSYQKYIDDEEELFAGFNKK